MPEIPSEVSERRKRMTASAEAALILRELAGPRPADESVKGTIRRVARWLGWRESRTKDLWYEDARRVDAGEMDTLRRARARRRAQEEAARADARVAIERLVALRAALASIDTDFHRETIAQIDNALRDMGAEIRAVAVR